MMLILYLILLSNLSLIEAVDLSHGVNKNVNEGGLEKSSEISSKCPQDCYCPEDKSGSSLETLLVNCVGLNLTQPPIPIEDSTASDLRLDQNKIATIDLVFLKHFPNLKVLNLNRNGLRYVYIYHFNILCLVGNAF